MLRKTILVTIASVTLLLAIISLPFVFGSTEIDEFLSEDLNLSMEQITNPGDTSLLINLTAENEKPFSLTPDYHPKIKRYCWVPENENDKLQLSPLYHTHVQSVTVNGNNHSLTSPIVIDARHKNTEQRIKIVGSGDEQIAEYVILVLPETFPPLRTEIHDIEKIGDGFIYTGVFVVQKLKHWAYISRVTIKEWGTNGFFNAFRQTLYTRFTIPDKANQQTNTTYDSNRAYLPYTFMTDKYGTPLFYKMAGMGFAAFRPYKNGLHYGLVQYYPQYAIGIGRTNMLDKNFQPDGSYKIERDDVKTELHEFRYLDDDRIIQVGAKEHPWNQGKMKSLESAFIQVTKPNGEIVFEWDSFDHVPPDVANAPTTEWSMRSYDYFHLNCVSPANDGNYIISGRHTQTIMKIDGTTGDVLWQMGQGKANDMTFIDDYKNGFAFQHAPYQLSNGNILLFDNGLNHQPSMSRVLEYSVDEEKRTATLIFSKEFPDHQAYVAGNAFRIENGNTIAAFGSQGYIEEFDEEGEKVLSIFPGGLVYQVMKAPLPWKEK